MRRAQGGKPRGRRARRAGPRAGGGGARAERWVARGRASARAEPPRFLFRLRARVSASVSAAARAQEVEPPPANSPLFTLENVLLTPHIGWKKRETRQRLVDMTADNVAALIAGRPTNVVN